MHLPASCHQSSRWSMCPHSPAVLMRSSRSPPLPEQSEPALDCWVSQVIQIFSCASFSSQAAYHRWTGSRGQQHIRHQVLHSSPLLGPRCRMEYCKCKTCACQAPHHGHKVGDALHKRVLLSDQLPQIPCLSVHRQCFYRLRVRQLPLNQITAIRSHPVMPMLKRAVSTRYEL